MTFKECRNLIAEDKARFTVDSTGKRISTTLTTIFRFGNYLMTKKSFFARILLSVVRPVYSILRLLTGIQLCLGTRVLGGAKIPSLFLHYHSTELHDWKELYYSSGRYSWSISLWEASRLSDNRGQCSNLCWCQNMW